jgi:hypothetical protein
MLNVQQIKTFSDEQFVNTRTEILLKDYDDSLRPRGTNESTFLREWNTLYWRNQLSLHSANINSPKSPQKNCNRDALTAGDDQVAATNDSEHLHLWKMQISYTRSLLAEIFSSATVELNQLYKQQPYRKDAA